MQTSKTDHYRVPFALIAGLVLACLCMGATALLAADPPPAVLVDHDPRPQPGAVLSTVRPAAGNTTQPAPRTGDIVELLAVGNENALYAARVQVSKDGSIQTHIQGLVGKPEQWMLIHTLVARPLSLTTLGDELAVLFEDGDWRLYSYSTQRSGLPLPGKSRMLLLTNDGPAALAIGLIPPGTTQQSLDPQSDADALRLPHDLLAWPPTTSPTSTRQPSPTTTQATTQAAGATQQFETQSPATEPATTSPMAQRLWYFRLDKGNWRAVAPLPAELQADQLEQLYPMDLEADQQIIWLVACVEPNRLRAWSLDANNHWQRRRDFVLQEPITRFKVMSRQDTPHLWVAGQSGPGWLYSLGTSATPIELSVQSDLSMPAPRVMTSYKAGYGLLFSQEGRLKYQPFSDTAQAMGNPQDIAVSDVDLRPILEWFFYGAVTLILVVGVFARANHAPKNPTSEVIAGLAPLGTRFMSGMIDLLPIFTAIVIETILFQGQNQELLQHNSQVMEIMTLGIAAYILLPLVMELIFGRSLGKMICGLRVLNIDGTLPGRWAIISRNLLRVLDIVLELLPTLTVLVTPLRQRLGDMAGGTVVVISSMQPRQADEPAKDPEDEDMDPSAR